MSEAVLNTAATHRLVTWSGVVFVGLASVVFGLLLSWYGVTALAAVVGMVIVGLVFYKPYLGFLLVVATLPADVFGVIAQGQSGVVLSVPKLAGAVTVTAMLFHGLVLRRWPSPKRFLNREFLAASALLAWMLICCLVHPTEAGVAEVIRLMTILVFLFVALWFLDRAIRFEHVLYVIVFVAVAVSIASIAQRYLGSAVVSEQWKAQAGAVRDVSEEQLGEILRTTGTFSHPAWLGLFLSVTIPLTLYTWATARRYSLALLALGFVVIEVLGVFSTYSRMAYIGAALGIALFMVRRRFGPLLLGLAATGAVVLFPVLPEDFQVRARSILDYDESSSSLTRIGQQIAGWRLILAHPLFGVGPGNFEDEVIQYRSGIGAPFRVEPIGAHNLYVEVAAELGLVGLLLLLYLIGCIWLDARRLRRAAVERNDDRSALFWECVGIGFVVFLVSALFVHAQYRKEWWLIAALVAAGRVLTAQRRANPQFETPRSGTSESNP